MCHLVIRSLVVMAAVRGRGCCRDGDDCLRAGDHPHHHGPLPLPLVMVMMPAFSSVLGLDVRHLPRVAAHGHAVVSFPVVYQAAKHYTEIEARHFGDLLEGKSPKIASSPFYIIFIIIMLCMLMCSVLPACIVP